MHKFTEADLFTIVYINSKMTNEKREQIKTKYVCCISKRKYPIQVLYYLC